MIDYQPLYNTLLDAKADAWVKLLPQQLASALDPARHGNLAQWQTVLECLPESTTTHRLLDADAIQIGRPEDLSEADKLELEHQLKYYIPGAKGPTTCSASIWIPNGGQTGSGIA